MTAASSHRETIARLREAVSAADTVQGPVLPFGIPAIDLKLARGGLDRFGLHEVAPSRPTLSDDAAASLFLAGIAARLVGTGGTALWVLTSTDLYAPGLEQAGLSPDCVVYAQARKDEEVLALAEDGLRQGCLDVVVAEVRGATMTQTRRLQLAAGEGRTPLLLLRRWRRADQPPLQAPSSALTRWSVGTTVSLALEHAGVGRARWVVEMVRQRNGNPFTLTVEACDDQGRLALPAAPRHRATAAERATARAA